jgi:biopolymer transport protein ExbB
MRVSIYLLLLIVSAFSSPLFAVSIDDVTQSLVADIKNAKRNLTKEQAVIISQQSELVEALHSKGIDVAKLRKKTAAATRQQDDQLLGIKQLSSRLQEWQSQTNYQQQLLLDLAQVIRPDQQQYNNGQSSPEKGMMQLNQYLMQQRTALYPQSHKQPIVLLSGEVVEADTLQLGPIKWFYCEDKSLSGLVENTSEVPAILTVFTGKKHEQLAALFNQDQGEITFDPTLEHLLKKQQSKESIADHLQKGGTWAIPILLFALIALVIALSKAWTLFRLPSLLPLFSERIALFQQKETVNTELLALGEQAKDAQHKMIQITLNNEVSQQRDDQIFAYLLGYRHRLERGIGAIAIIASVSPLLGLLGTVSGMIETFRMMTLFGAGDPSAVSGGISEALVTTELGLIVAIPALILHAVLNRRVKSRCLALETQAIQLSQLHTGNADISSPVQGSN